MAKHPGGRPRTYNGEGKGKGAPKLAIRLNPDTLRWIQGMECEELRALTKAGEKPDAAPKDRRRVKGAGWVRYLLEDLHSGRLEVHDPLCAVVRPVSSEPTPDDSVPSAEKPHPWMPNWKPGEKK